MAHVQLIYGPPGTGKTTTLLRYVEEAVSSGVPSNRIGYLAFTRRAASEARIRASLGPKGAPYFRTIHSLCFEMIGMSRNRMFGRDDRQLFEKTYGLRLHRPDTYEVTNDDGYGAYLLHLYDGARISGRDLEAQYRYASPDSVSLSELQGFAKLYEQHKRSHGVLDFTDLLLRYLSSTQQTSPPLDVLVVDEAQDLSPLQWDVVKRIMEESEPDTVYIAGDDDQTVFRWAGADADTLLSMEGERRVLEQSYRVPGLAWKMANNVIHRVRRRQPKSWRPTTNEGSVNYVLSAEDIDYSEGTWLLLARDNYTLQPVANFLKGEGFLYSWPNHPALPSTAMDAVLGWERIRAGSPNKGDRVCAERFMSRESRRTNIGKASTFLPWYEALDLLSREDRSYLRAARRRGESTRAPRIRVSSIHSAKGAEADNVVLFMDVSPRVGEAIDRGDDDEDRVLYVGLTRTANRLFIVEPNTSCHFMLA